MVRFSRELSSHIRGTNSYSGRLLGFRCTHAYAHANSDFIGGLPYALKGLDAIVYSTFSYLGCRVKVLPELQQTDEMDDRYDDDSDDEEPSGNDMIGRKLHTTAFGDEVPEGERVYDVCTLVIGSRAWC